MVIAQDFVSKVYHSRGLILTLKPILVSIDLNYHCIHNLNLSYQSIDDVRTYLKAIVESNIDGEFGME